MFYNKWENIMKRIAQSLAFIAILCIGIDLFGATPIGQVVNEGIKKTDEINKAAEKTLQEKLAALEEANTEGNFNELEQLKNELAQGVYSAVGYIESTKDMFWMSNEANEMRKQARIKKEDYEKKLSAVLAAEEKNNQALSKTKIAEKINKYKKNLKNLHKRKKILAKLIDRERIALGEKWTASRKALLGTLTVAAATAGIVLGDKYIAKTGLVEKAFEFAKDRLPFGSKSVVSPEEDEMFRRAYDGYSADQTTSEDEMFRKAYDGYSTMQPHHVPKAETWFEWATGKNSPSPKPSTTSTDSPGILSRGGNLVKKAAIELNNFAIGRVENWAISGALGAVYAASMNSLGLNANESKQGQIKTMTNLLKQGYTFDEANNTLIDPQGQPVIRPNVPVSNDSGPASQEFLMMPPHN